MALRSAWRSRVDVIFKQGSFLNNRICFTLFLFLSLGAQLFAFGRVEETEIVTHNDEWVLCVTDFDVSSVPEEKLSVAGVITRKFVEKLNVISYRTRVSPEYAYYEGYAWSQARSGAARALSAKNDERSMLVYRGDPAWMYRQNLARVDAEIERLTAALEDIERQVPLINEQPSFRLTAGNVDFSFPAAPAAGAENKFCLDQMADAFLTGSIVDFYGRYYVSIKLFTVYAQSFVYEDNIIFSTEDLENALEEISRRLIIVLSGNEPAAIAVRTEPEEALVLINRTFVNRGETAPLEYPPGKITITASAPDHESLTVETELSPGELAEVDIFLSPLVYGNINIPGTLSGGSVYNGALYVGETPLTLRLPLNTMEYIELETHDNQRGTIAFNTPDRAGASYSLSFNTEFPLEEGRVDRARRWYYWAWGGTWITGITAWITYHTYVNADASIRYNYMQTGSYNQNFADYNTTMYYVSMGTMIAAGLAIVHEIFQIGRYVYTANKGSPAIVRTGR
jgi:hypothetical protein